MPLREWTRRLGALPAEYDCFMGEPRPAGVGRRPGAVNHLTTARVKTERKVRVVYQTVDEARAALRAKGIDPTVIECAMMPKFLLPKPLLTGIGAWPLRD